MTLGVSQTAEAKDEQTLKKSPSITNISKFTQPKPLPISFNMKISEELAEIKTALGDLKFRSKNNNQSLVKLNENLARFNETTGGEEREELKSMVEDLKQTIQGLALESKQKEPEQQIEKQRDAPDTQALQLEVEALRTEKTDLLVQNRAAAEKLLQTEKETQQLQTKCSVYATHLKTLESQLGQLELRKQHLISSLEQNRNSKRAPSGTKLLELLTASSDEGDLTSRSGTAAGVRSDNKENQRTFSAYY
ncbi:hypothetical protein OGAPHI_002957 [Ogataea philodendri]|uniref:Uncharacterized protein n=1 Tax=Ogataea philodendri TaxID=1378263 RepID=A0A9P8T5S3_9ASCO|nr:uncharacterized protein OGAPHI_002957 [Ogataea philodendri]KAH3667308.1 hypothetical protein OGAPHI_002957 [Ogataea philodendri]